MNIIFTASRTTRQVYYDTIFEIKKEIPALSYIVTFNPSGKIHVKGKK